MRKLHFVTAVLVSVGELRKNKEKFDIADITNYIRNKSYNKEWYIIDKPYDINTIGGYTTHGISEEDTINVFLELIDTEVITNLNQIIGENGGFAFTNATVPPVNRPKTLVEVFAGERERRFEEKVDKEFNKCFGGKSDSDKFVEEFRNIMSDVVAKKEFDDRMDKEVDLWSDAKILKASYVQPVISPKGNQEYDSKLVSAIDEYISDQHRNGKSPTLKQIQSRFKKAKMNCTEISHMLVTLGYKPQCIESKDIHHPSKWVVNNQ